MRSQSSSAVSWSGAAGTKASWPPPTLPAAASPRVIARPIPAPPPPMTKALFPESTFANSSIRRTSCPGGPGLFSSSLRNVTPPDGPNGESASANITERIEELGDWRGETLAHVRQLIHDADPDIEEEWKWAKATSSGTPVWSHDGGVCTGESYKEVVKLTFFRGASIEDPKKLFNSSLGGNTRRAIDIREEEKIDEAAFKELIRAAVAANSAARAQRAAKKK